MRYHFLPIYNPSVTTPIDIPRASPEESKTSRVSHIIINVLRFVVHVERAVWHSGLLLVIRQDVDLADGEADVRHPI
jgi:hypothetical protein